MQQDALIFVAGHKGLVGSAVLRRLQAAGYRNLLTRTRQELDLLERGQVERFFAEQRPQYVILAAAKVGGILANDTYRADFIRENLLIQTHVIHAAARQGTRRLVFLGSSCIYPKLAPQPMKEEYLLGGPLEPTNDAYAIAKIAGILTCQAYQRQYGLNAISLMPTNLYGPGDNFDLHNSHALPALIRKMHEAKKAGTGEVLLWGTGKARREFLHVDDLASAILFLLERDDSPALLNVGTGTDLTIAELASLIREVVGFQGSIRYDTAKPDGTPRKLLDVSRLSALGWQAGIPLRQGLTQTYAWFLENEGRLRQV